MRVDRNAAAIVGHGEKAVGAQFHLDEGGMAGQRLVHRVVDDFGEQMMQRLFVGAADIHARPAPHRLEAFQHLDVGGGVAGLGAGGARRNLDGGPALRLRSPEQVVGGLSFSKCFQRFRHVFSYVTRGFTRGGLSAANLFF